MYFTRLRGILFFLACPAAISCDSNSTARTPATREASPPARGLATAVDTVSRHSFGTPLDSADFVIAGLSQGSDSAAVVARLKRPDSVSIEHNQYDEGAALSTWHYRAMDVDFVVATVQSFEILGPGVSTARGVRVGDTVEAMRAAYGEPSSRYEEDWTYSDPKQDLHQITFTVRAGHIVKVFIGTGLD
jgi:hypothetical protein